MEKNTSKFNEEFIKSYDKDSDIGYIPEADGEYPKRLHNLHKDLPFLPERIKIKKCKKLYDKNNYVTHIENLKQALNYGLVLMKAHKVIQFNQKAWDKSYIDMNTTLRTEGKNDFEKDFFKLMCYAVFGKTMENVRKHRYIKLVTTNKIRNYLVSKPNYHTAKCLSEKILAMEMKNITVKMIKPLHLGLSELEISKTLIYEFWYDYIKPKYQYNAKLCYMDTDSFIIHIKT